MNSGDDSGNSQDIQAQMPMVNQDGDPYFAEIQDPQELSDAVKTKIREWRNYCTGKQLIGLWEKKLRNYYGNSLNGNSSQAVLTGGSEGEVSLMKVNDLRNLLQNQLVMVTSQRPAGQARAVNSDTKSLKQAKIGTALAEYYMTSHGFEQNFINAVESALLVDEAFVLLNWNKEAGDPIAVDPDTTRPLMSGDLEMSIHCPWNVARDPGMNIGDQKWFIITMKDNKYDLAATYPKFSTEILSCTGDDEQLTLNYIPPGSDAIYKHLLVHERTAGCPEGRFSLLIGDTIVLDTVLPYKEFPIERIASSDVIDGCLGYSSANDIMGIEEATDALYSAVLSNNITFALQHLVAPQGVDIQVSDLAKGLRLFEMDPAMVGKLIPLQLTKSAPETYQLINQLSSKKEQMVGVNAVVRGDPSAAGMSGASGSALALIQSQAISFNSGTQRSFFRLLSSTMTKAIGILRSYADTPRVAALVGKSNATGLKEFKYTGADLNSISSIVYEMVNPVSQTIGGRLQMAQDLIKANQIKSPKQYINVISTGQLDVLTEDDESDGMLILEENEALMEGQDIEVVATEMHGDHVKSHMSVISSVSAKKDPNLVSRVMAHVQKHLDTWGMLSKTNPGLLFATGQQPLPQPPPQAPPAPPPGGPPPNVQAPPPPGLKLAGPGGTIGTGQSSGVQQKAQTVNLPNLPTNPLTKEKAQVPGVLT